MVMEILRSKLYVHRLFWSQADISGNGSDESCFYQEYHIASIEGLGSRDRTYMHLILNTRVDVVYHPGSWAEMDVYFPTVFTFNFRKL